MSLAKELARLLPEDKNGEITLVDQNNYLLFTPMLTEVAGAELDARHVVAAPRRLTPRVNFEQGRIEGIDLKSKSITLTPVSGSASNRTFSADHMVIALGAVTNFHHIPGLQEHSLSIKSLGDAVALRNRVLQLLERAHLEPDQNVRRKILTFVVAGGGSTGVETMAALNDLVRSAAANYQKGLVKDISTILVEPGERLLSEFSPDLAGFAKTELERRGVQVRLNTKVSSAGPDYVEIEGGSGIPTETLIWAAGIKPNPIIEKLDCKRGHHGGIVVDEFCSVQGCPGVWAVGDCAEVPKSGDKTYAPTAQNATREGKLVAQNIVRSMRGEKPRAFRFKPLGELALVGRHAGIAKILNWHLSGAIAWAMWRGIYLAKMPGTADRARVLLDWLLDSLFGRSIVEFPVGSSR